ncbi:hypothetical protein IWQ61_008670 [Dispira simplex]|nr:hypothetical protein IWQ61_008670 [Dispira simplex]
MPSSETTSGWGSRSLLLVVLVLLLSCLVHAHGGPRKSVLDIHASPSCPLEENCPFYEQVVKVHQAIPPVCPPDCASQPPPADHHRPDQSKSAGQLPPGHPPVAKTTSECPFARLQAKLGLGKTTAPPPLTMIKSSDPSGCRWAWLSQHLAYLWPTTTSDNVSFWNYLFSSDPKISSFLATAYISIFPNLVLLFVPPNISPDALNILVSFAVGGLLGDVLLHLLPHIFLEIVHDPPQEHPNQIKVVGLAIFFGLLAFFVIDRVMRLGNNQGHSHSHSHGHHHHHSVSASDYATSPTKDEMVTGQSTAISASTNTTSPRQRHPTSPTDEASPAVSSQCSDEESSVKFSAYLNLIADATHNFTDGLAMAASFYSSPAIGITTTVAVFFHEIPHEIGDYAILVQSGLSRRQALWAQCVTALGAFAGTLAGVLIQEMGTSQSQDHTTASSWWLAGLSWGDLVIPFTAGGFIYIATVTILPELLTSAESQTTASSTPRRRPWKQVAYEMGAMLLGVALIAMVNEG